LIYNNFVSEQRNNKINSSNQS